MPRPTAPKKPASEFLKAAATTFEERNATYKDNYLNVGRAMEALFPDGMAISSADDWNRLHILLLQVVKLTRYCENWSTGGHADSIHDATVYSAMLESIDADIQERRNASQGTRKSRARV